MSDLALEQTQTPEPPRSEGRVAPALGLVRRALAGALQAIDADVVRHVAQAPLLGATMLVPGRRRVAAGRDDGHRPIVFVHGLGGHPGNFLPMTAWLWLAGRRRTYAWDGRGAADPERQVNALRAFLAEVVRVNDLADDETLDVVAHSMGGIVARCALEDPETARRVSTLVTLGTPHAGSHAARYFATPALRALRPDSQVMRRLARQLPWTGAPRLVCFWSPADVFLLPPSTAAVEGAVNHELQGTTHYGYLLEPACWRRVLATLAPDSAGAPDERHVAATPPAQADDVARSSRA